jgi:D-amino-acid oxidase
MRSDRDKPIAIIGGGVSGVTTAVLLQVAGYTTIIYARALPQYGPSANVPPAFATPHAAASILPHSITSPNVVRWTDIGQAFFRALAFRASCGVRSQPHYEIFEAPDTPTPDYAASVENFRRLTLNELAQLHIPRRTGATQTSGWTFDAFFATGPDYLAWLYDFYAALGGTVRQPPGDGRLTACFAQGHDICVNCTGAESHAFLDAAAADPAVTSEPPAPEFEPLADPAPAKLIRGFYILVDLNRVPNGDRGRFFSYNYKPAPSIYQTADGAPADVYCYPRSDAWLLGGARQEGTIDAAGDWIGETTAGREITLPRAGAPPLAVPAPILELNADILLRLTGGTLDLSRLLRNDPAIAVPGVGYRYVRDSATDNVRLGCSRVSFAGAPRHVLHNYGHGGSGFTLSWGCALDILQWLRRLTATSPKPPAAPFAIGHVATRRHLRDLVDRLLPAA